MSALLTVLAVRCAKAEGPDRDIDRAIADAIGERCGRFGYADEEEEIAYPYTASLDMAWRIVPEGWTWGHVQRCDRQPEFAALLRPNLDGNGDFDFWTDFVACRAKTPQLAICAAALRARCQQELARLYRRPRGRK